MKQQDAARAVLIEVMNVLGAFKDDIVIVGGWVPDLTYPNKKHIGSLDVDLAIGPNAVGEDVYSSILNRLKESDYSHYTSPTRFMRAVPEASEPVKVDLISGEYLEEGEKTRAIMVNELKVNSLRGVDLAFENSKEITIEGKMPNGSENVVQPELYRQRHSFSLRPSRSMNATRRKMPMTSDSYCSNTNLQSRRLLKISNRSCRRGWEQMHCKF